MNYTLKELLDIPKLRELLDSLEEISRMPSAILDTEGTILSATAWQDICTKFHRVNPDTEKKCLESDRHIQAGLVEKLSYTSYHCPMGLVDAAMSLVIEGKHLGNVFVGQFFLEQPDEAYFIKQARQYCFDENEYLEAMRKVPIFSEDQLRKNLTFIGKFSQMLAEQGLQHKRQCEAEEALRKSEATLLKLTDTLQDQYQELQVNEESLREQNDELLSVEEMLRVQIEEYENSQKLLKDSEERFKALHDASFGGIIIHDKGLILDCNQALSEMTGFTNEELVGMDGLKLIAPDWLEVVIQNIQSGYEQGYEVEGLRKDGSKYPLAIRGKNIPYKGHHARVIEFRDITERTRAEEAMRKSEALYRLLTEDISDVVWKLDNEYRFTYISPADERMRGFSADEVVGHHVYELFTDDGIEIIKEMTRKRQEAEQSGKPTDSVTFEVQQRCKDGRLIWTEILSTPERDETGAVSGFHGVSREITARKRVEAALIQEQLFAKKLIESLPGIFYLYTYPELDLVLWNKNHETLLGFDSDEMKGRNLLDWHIPEAQEAIRSAVEMVMEKGISAAEAPLVAKDGRLVPFHMTGVKFEAEGTSYLMGIGIDVTERKRAEDSRISLEKQLLHAQKLESLGVLAGGIAHDFNNILMSIIGNADLALMRLNRESPAVENLHRIEQAAARAADLAKQMLAYSGKGKFVVENLDLNILLEEMLHMLEVSISKKAVLRLNLHQSLPPVEADATQMRQIIMNLVINASEAIGDKSGVIAITTGCMDCDSSYLKDVWLDENITEGLYVYLEIADTGCGMDKETLAKLFDPFFTTKFTGRGLGMAAVLGIVRGHKGAIKVYSELKKGTTFKILLPASGRPVEIFNHDNHHDSWQGTGTVLLVDDEETVRGIGSEMLKELGFKAITANDGREAVEIFKTTPGIDLVILDLTMPHMDGEQCFRELRQLNPDVKVIMSSGYNEQEVTQKFVGKGLAGFVQKPYKLSVLKEAVKQIVAAKD